MKANHASADLCFQEVTLRLWLRQSYIDTGLGPGGPGSEDAELRAHSSEWHAAGSDSSSQKPVPGDRRSQLQDLVVARQ